MSGKRGPEGDLRVRRTRAHLRDSLVALVEEKGYEAVTVRELTARAMVNRATFYAHYDDKYDLLLDVVGTAFEAVRANPPLARGGSGGPEDGGPAVETPEWLVAFLEGIAARAGFYRGLLGDAGSARVKADLRTYVEGLIRARIRAAGVTDATAAVPPEVVVGFAASAALGSLTWWLENGTPYPPARAAEWYLEFMASGVFRPLGLAPPRGGDAGTAAPSAAAGHGAPG